MVTSAQYEGAVEQDEETFSLRLSVGDSAFDVTSHTDTDDRCEMSVSNATARALQQFQGREGDLLDDNGYLVHRLCLLSSDPDTRYVLSPHSPGCGTIVGRILV